MTQTHAHASSWGYGGPCDTAIWPLTKEPNPQKVKWAHASPWSHTNRVTRSESAESHFLLASPLPPTPPPALRTCLRRNMPVDLFQYTVTMRVLSAVNSILKKLTFEHRLLRGGGCRVGNLGQAFSTPGTKGLALAGHLPEGTSSHLHTHTHTHTQISTGARAQTEHCLP